MSALTDKRGTSNARHREQRGVEPPTPPPMYAQVSGSRSSHKRTSDIQSKPPQPTTLILIGRGLRSEGSLRVTPAVKQGQVERSVVTRYYIPEVSQAAGFNQAVTKYLEQKNGHALPNPVVVSVSSENEVRAAIKKFGSGVASIQYLGHMKIAKSGTTGKWESTHLKLFTESNIMNRQSFIQLAHDVGAQPAIWGCFGAEGPGTSAGATDLVALRFSITVTKQAMLKAQASQVLNASDIHIGSVHEEEKDDLQQFLENSRF